MSCVVSIVVNNRSLEPRAKRGRFAYSRVPFQLERGAYSISGLSISHDHAACPPSGPHPKRAFLPAP